MTIGETAERVIALPPERVAAYAMDWLTGAAAAGGFGVDAEVTSTARFLGRRIDYVPRFAAYDRPGLLWRGLPLRRPGEPPGDGRKGPPSADRLTLPFDRLRGGT